MPELPCSLLTCSIELPFKTRVLLSTFSPSIMAECAQVAKGARGAKSRSRSILQPFQPLLISLSGRSDLKTLTGVEPMHEALRLEATRLFSGLYVNELLARLLQDHEEHRALFGFYQDTLVSLQGISRIDSVLRHFELSLLSELGYGLNLETECDLQHEISAAEYYRFDAQRGFSLVSRASSSEQNRPGSHEPCSSRRSALPWQRHHRAA
jgi:DNA repair protein RecO (recombination protein O)